MSQRTENISHGVLLIGLGILAMTHNWWPNLLVVLGVYFSFRNLLNRFYLRMLTTAIIYGGVYFCVQYPFFISWEFILPIVLCTLGVERILGEFVSIRKKRPFQSTTKG